MKSSLEILEDINNRLHVLNTEWDWWEQIARDTNYEEEKPITMMNKTSAKIEVLKHVKDFILEGENKLLKDNRE